ncbi:MAG: winged helix-turn-helix transcriptional regulator [Chlamydiae bacterium]|nr:winged helix-turn-helix transcriptional regulator [Chlamydiota bacterium]
MKYPAMESSILEFKEVIPQKDQIVKTIIGFCNQNGGKLIIGVSDNGEITGISLAEAVKAVEFLSQSIYDACIPPILPLVYTQTMNDRTLLIVEVSSGTNKPYYRKSEGLEKGTYIRLGSVTLKATADIIEELKWQARGRAFDTLPVYGTSEQDLDSSKIREFIRLRETEKGMKITQELLRSYHLITQEHVHTYASSAGILLFGKEPQRHFSEAMIICTHFKGIEGREALATIDCVGTLFEQFERAFDFILSRLSRSFIIKTPQRKEALEIPSKAIREALLNMIVHRNYRQSSPSKIAIYQNRIEFFSPGTFFGPLTPQNLKQGLSFIRNIAICKVFREARYIEKMGSGLITIFKTYEEGHLKPPSIIEGAGFVKCILPRELMLEEATSEDMQAILALFEVASEIKISDIMRSIKISRTTVGRRLQQLQKQGMIEQIGTGKGTRYRKL